MITYFSILIKTKRTFKYLIENDEGNYRLRTDLIFILSGLVTGVIVFFDRDWSMNGIIAKLFPFVFIVIIRFILYKFVFSFLIL